MKSLLSNLLCASLLFFAVGCGKDKGGSSSGLSMNPVISPNFPQSGQVALDNLKAWYAIPETRDLGFRGVYQKKSQSTSSGFNFDFSFCFFGRGSGCNTQSTTPTHCFIRGNNGYNVGTATGTSIPDCHITQTNVTKTTNAELNQAVNGNGVQLLDVRQQGNVYHLVYGSNIYQPSLIYTIDTSYHSILNPIQVQTITNGQVNTTTITNFQSMQF